MGFKRTLPDADPRACPVCGTVFTPQRKFWKQIFCGHRCAITRHHARMIAAAASPEAIRKSADTRRGKGKGNGYIKRGGRHEHRVVAEQKLGRPLLPGETVHHRDENKRNNAPDNLEVMATRADHTRLHNTGKKHRHVTHCKRGHELSGNNVYVHPTTGSRVCITCRRVYDNNWKKNRRQQQCASSN